MGNNARRITLRDFELEMVKVAIADTTARLCELKRRNQGNSMSATADYFIRLYNDILVKLVNLPYGSEEFRQTMKHLQRIKKPKNGNESKPPGY